ncbi:MAG: GntR family transcriptional regulator [Candidatus Accumulibacter sp.]|nr:GntR family transcriptional regulator [Accumulibacter sp.]
MTPSTKITGLLSQSLADKSIVDRVMDRITGAIINGELKPGDKIPTELELADSFQVGRNSVREAIKVLEAFGVLRIRRAEGTFVSEKFNRRMLDPMLYGLILRKDAGTEIHDLRRVFDTGVLHVAITKADGAAIEVIRFRLEELRQAASAKPFLLERLLTADVAFHEAVVASVQNALLSSIAGYIDRITIPSRTETMREIAESGQLDAFVELHERILGVLEKHDVSGIVDTVKDHYQFWRRQIAYDANY